MNYTLTEIAEIVNGNISITHIQTKLTQVCIDTRQISNPASSLFFCLIGKADGHDFIATAYQKGIRHFVISKEINTADVQDASFILVKDTLVALQQLATYHRQQFSIPVVGITGSNGKTIVKEWLYQLLSDELNVVKSPKSYNSKIGVPLSVLNLQPEHQFAIFEAGVSTVNEMDVLQKIIQPTLGIFTNIGSAHNSGFSDLTQKTKEKLNLFSSCTKVIYTSKYAEIKDAVIGNPVYISWGFQSTDDYVITHFVKEKTKSTLQLNGISYTLPFTDDASVENAIHCIVFLKELNYTDENIQAKINVLHNLPMRLELKYGINNCSIIDDSYSADMHSFKVALDFLNQQESNKSRTLIISEFEESGLTEDAFIKQLIRIIQEYRFSKLIGIGPFFKKAIESINGKVKEWYIYETTEQFIEQFHLQHFENEFILLKGARRFGFEKISALLVGQTHETVLEVNLNALLNNLNVYKAYLPTNCGVIAMVKAFSYGSGTVEVASLLEKNHVDYLAVAYADEGVTLRKSGIRTPIMVMNPDVKDFDRMLEYQLEPEIYSVYILQQLIDFFSNRKEEMKPFAVHLKIETGMNRLGLKQQDLTEFIEVLKTNKAIEVKTIFSHLSGSEDAQFDEFTQQQIDLFQSFSQQISHELKQVYGNLYTEPKRHILNSAGIIRFPDARFDYVRLGIGLYGVDGSQNIQDKLLPIGRLKTRIAQIKIVEKGETIGYSRKGIANETKKIAVLAIGYADGYDRRFGNGVGEVFISGKKASIIGNVCMDMCMADITHIDEVKEGDEVEIYGSHISIIEQAKKIGTIPYELLTGISPRVKRLYFLD